jgi:lipopolysaccharide/colanic/teichoic acid biosynthesis glycosyltransferase
MTPSRIDIPYPIPVVIQQGKAQVMYPYASSFEQTAEKLEYDMYYLKNMSFFLDMAILLKTIRVVLMGKGK